MKVNLYLATDSGLAALKVEGDSCSCNLRLEGQRVQCIAVDPLNRRVLYCGTFGDGVWRSDDAGRNWRPAGKGITHSKVFSMAVSRSERADGQRAVYAGTEPSALFRSQDGGRTWRECSGLTELDSASQWSFPPRPETHHIRWIQPDPHSEGGLFVAVEAGALVRSPDGGTSWQDRTPDSPRDTHQMAAPLSMPGRLYSAAGDGYFESRDGGETWQQPQDGLLHRYLWSVAIDAGDAENVIVSAAASARHSHRKDDAESFLYRRTAGSPWQQTRRGLPGPAGRRTAALAAHPSQPATFFAAWESDILRSVDGGSSWERLDVSWPEGFQVNEPRTLAAAEAE